MQYTISYTDADTRFIEFELRISGIHQDLIHLQLPSWRPGRYELQNYAKNIRNFGVYSVANEPLDFHKITKDRWEINSHGIHELVVRYEYYANQPDAGASYLCKEFLYINPVNCMMYAEGRQDEPYTVHFKLPESYQIACQLNASNNHQLQAERFDQLADSPLFASDSLQHHAFQINEGNNTIHFWFQGKHPFDLSQLEADTRKYAEFQTRLFGDMPSKAFHFLYLMLETPFRHGVEHMDSTVIAMGYNPELSVEDFYHDLLAISSHELFHLWNVKRIRPADMLPYDFTRENYSTLGYVYEGVTTYYGDLALLRSGVWSLEYYLKNLSNDLKRHFNNTGRFHYSVAESSWDTWLDGYVAGVPGRKVSIYVEGMIAAMIADLIMLRYSNGAYRLDHVLHELYQNDAKKHQGYTENRYSELLVKYGLYSVETYMQELIHGKGQMEKWLRELMEWVGMNLDLKQEEDLVVPYVSILTEKNNDRNVQLKNWMSDFTV